MVLVHITQVIPLVLSCMLAPSSASSARSMAQNSATSNAQDSLHSTSNANLLLHVQLALHLMLLCMQIGIFNHVSYLDAFVVVWAFCACGVTFAFSKHIPILGYGVRALQNLYLPEEKDKGKQSASVVQMIKERCAVTTRSWGNRFVGASVLAPSIL